MEASHPVLDTQQETQTPIAQRAGTPARKGWLRVFKKTWGFYVALLPTFILLAIFGYYPALSGFYHSVFDWRPGFDSPFIGFANFQMMFQDQIFWKSFENVGQMFVFGVTVAWILPMLAAELIITFSSERLRFIFRTLLIVPFAFPGIVTILLWGFLYDPNSGMINTLLKDIGLGRFAQNWLGNPHIALYSLMFLGAPWIASVPFLIFLSALQAIPTEMFDAASIDGASRWTRFFSIDLPMIGKQIPVLFILAIIQILQYSVPAALLTNGGPAYATMMPVIYLLNTAFISGNWGYAATLSMTLFVIMFVLSIVVIRVQRIGKKKVAAAAVA